MTGEIRMLKWGIIPTLPSFQISVGQSVGGIKQNFLVLEIVSEPIVDGRNEFHIQCSKQDAKGVPTGIPFVWMTYKKEPDSVQYFGPDETHDYLKV
ncbi:MAG: hypothetical protein AABY22_05645 [Nanoarchaeota archaeon]